MRSVLEKLEERTLLTADVFISEFSASNDLVLVDEDGDSPDWVEIYNAGPDDVDLDGWHLTDDQENLSKWSFPSQTLAAGNFLIVHASDKDRAEAGGPLHTNFKLSSDGEYLGLTRNVNATTVEVVSDFDPGFPFQFTDVSYGVAQTVVETQISSPTADAKIFFPTNNGLGTSWRTPGFNDSAWEDATAGIGYQLKVPGFTVQDAKSDSTINNLDLAYDLLDGVDLQSETITIASVVNFLDPGGGGGSGNFSGDDLFPNDTNADDNDFAVRATGTITIPIAGTWTFGINSDDGSQLLIDGNEVIDDDTLHAPRDTYGRTFLTAGEHEIEMVFFERGGGAEVELFAARGSFSGFNPTFRLVGDVANGGLEVNTSPTGTTSSFSSLYQTDVSEEMLNQSTDVFLRVPFDVSNPASLDSLTLRLNYDDGFVAYLNGTEVARRNAPAGNVPANSAATADRPRIEAEFFESIDISPFLSDLNSGENVLAIHGLNDSIDSDEFVIRAELTEVSVTNGDLFYFNTPSPRDFNPSTGVEGFLTNEISFSQPHGFYTDAFPLTITAATADTTIRYTTDGSEPTETNGTVYGSPITIDETTTIRARSFKAGLDPSFVETQTYLFLDDVIEQRPSDAIDLGFPSSSVNGQVVDYGLDPDIVNSDIWGPQLVDAFTQIPSVSLVLDSDALFDSEEGIYVNAGSHGRSWERPASLELINPDGTEGFTVNAGLRIRGGFSRRDANPKHSFRLFFRDEYGDAKLDYPLFGEEGAEQFDKIDFRTAQNYSWTNGGGDRNTFLRDVFSRDVQGALGNPYTRGDYFHLYINGQYWGLFQTEERPEANFARDYFGGSSDDYDVVKSTGSSGGYQNEATDGNLEAYERLANLFYQRNGLSDANHADFMRAQGLNPDGSVNPDYERLLDIDNLIDYMLITYYTSDADGPGSQFTRPRVNNYFAIYNREDPDGFKFFEHDSEHSLDTGNAAGANYNLVEPFTEGGSQFRYFNPHWMHEQLASSNTEYRTQFMDRVTEQLFNDGVLTAENALSMIQSRASEIDQAIIAESARWGDAREASPFTKDDWVEAVGRIEEFIEGRRPVLLDQLRNVDWYPDENPPEFLVNSSPQHGGGIDTNDEIAIATSTTFSFDQTLVSRGSVWKFLDNGSNQGTAWRATSFNDAAWNAGNAELGYGDGNEATEVSFGSNSNDKHVTTYYRKSFDVADPQSVDGLKIQLRRDDGAVVYLNGTEVARSNLPSGTIDFETSASSVVGGSDETTYFEFEIDAELLNQGNNVLAVEVHQIVGNGGTVTSSDTSFDLALLGGSISLSNSKQIYYTTDGSDPRLSGGAINPDAILFDPADGFTLSGDSQVTARTRDGDEWGTALTANFEVAVAVDDMPEAIADTINATEDTLASANVGSNDSLSSDGGNVFALVANASNGVATVAANGAVTYSPNANFNGSDSFQYRLTDTDGDASVATVTVNVASVNDLPVVANDSVSGNEDTQISGNVSTNDTLSGDGGNTFSLVSNPASGSVNFNSNGTFAYTPDANFNGSDSFSYGLTDANGDARTATVNVSVASVDDQPIVTNDSFSATEDTVLNGNVGTNDTLSGDGGNEFSLVASPSNGSVALNDNGQFAYTPAANFNGSDSFTYQLVDADGDSRTGTVSLLVDSVDDLPLAFDDTFLATEDLSLSGNVLTNDVLSGDGGNVVAVATTTSNGTLSLAANGQFTYTPTANFSGSDSFTYSLTDADGDVVTSTVSITVAEAADVPVASNDVFAATEDVVFSGNVGSNDALSGDGGNVFVLSSGTANGGISLNTNGTFTYTPNANFNGSDAFSYTLRDADGDTSTSTATATINVASVNDLPVAFDDSVSTDENNAVSGNVSENDVLSADGGNTYRVSVLPSDGQVTMNANGTFTYVPNLDFSGSDSFSYELTDVDGDVRSAVVSVSVADVVSSILGDLNNDGTLSAEDIDLLLAGLSENSSALRLDVNEDDVVDQQDLDYMIETIFRTLPGDADLDGDVDFADFLILSANFGNSDTGWQEGNFNPDEETSFTDFLLLSANFGWVRES